MNVLTTAKVGAYGIAAIAGVMSSRRRLAACGVRRVPVGRLGFPESPGFKGG